MTYPLSLLIMGKRRLSADESAWVRPKVAICMSAFNEEKVIVAKVESLLDMVRAYGPAEIYVYVDGADRNLDRHPSHGICGKSDRESRVRSDIIARRYT